MMVHLFKSSLEARDPSIRGLSWFVNHEAMMRNAEWDADRSKYQTPLPLPRHSVRLPGQCSGTHQYSSAERGTA